jgi:hypothetical protein
MGLTVRFWHCMGNQGMARSRSSAWRPELTRGFLSFLKRKVTRPEIDREGPARDGSGRPRRHPDLV